MSEQERIMNVALLLWGGCFCLTAAFCLSMGNDHNREKRNWLLWMELSAAALLCCDAAAWFVQGTPGEASHLIMVATNFVVYAGLYLVLFLFNHYVGCYLREDGRLCAPKRSRTVDITCAVGIGLVFVSQFSPLFYYIDAQNIYHRSDAFPLSMVLLLIGMGTETTMMAQFYQKLTMGRRIAMFGCVVLPLSVAACQVFQDDISLISLSVGASMILLFVVATSAQNRELAVSERTKEQIRQRLEIATVLNSCVGKLNSDTDIDVGINNLLATVNGTNFAVLAENISRERSFGQTSIRLTGRGKNAVLAAPYAPVMTFTNSQARTARQLMDDVLTINGVPMGWDLDWGLTDWNVPAGVFSHQRTWIEALSVIAGAAGGYLLPHPRDPTIRVRHRYPVAPWEWATVTPNFVLPVDAVEKESLRWLEKPSYNRVFVSGQEAGVLAQVTRSGTAGDLLAPMVVDALITEAAVARQRGLAVLSDTGRQIEVSLNLPVLLETGIIEPGAFVQYRDGGVDRIGLVRSTQVQAGFPEVWQTLGVQTYA